MIVHDSPYYAVTDERGAFRIDGVPPGTYKVTMWHEGFRPKGLDKDGRPLYDEPRTVTQGDHDRPQGDGHGRLRAQMTERASMYKHIYVPVDNSDYSNRAIDLAVELGRGVRGEAHGLSRVRRPAARLPVQADGVHAARGVQGRDRARAPAQDPRLADRHGAAAHLRVLPRRDEGQGRGGRAGLHAAR